MMIGSVGSEVAIGEGKGASWSDERGIVKLHFEIGKLPCLTDVFTN